jgi:hypothetical protein
MQTYYYYYELDAAGHIFARRDIEARNDAEAVSASWNLQIMDSQHHGFEVWIGCRLVFQSQCDKTARAGLQVTQPLDQILLRPTKGLAVDEGRCLTSPSPESLRL